MEEEGTSLEKEETREAEEECEDARKSGMKQRSCVTF